MITYISHLGKVLDELPALPAPSRGQLSLNTPVGSCIDLFGHTWLADTAHNRLLVFDAELQQLLASYGHLGTQPGEFNMPFRLLSHPEKPWIYVTDMANQRIQILEYDQQLKIRPVSCFGNQIPSPLTGPNGIVFYQNKLCVADEFYEGAEGESRLVIFDDQGHYLREIKSITYPDQQQDDLDLLWPQGLSLDKQGNIYIANTGFNTLVRCDWEGQARPFSDNGKAYIDGLELTRDVACIDDYLLIPGGEANAIAVYGLDGKKLGRLRGFFAPIQITQAQQPDCLLITEPLLASLQLHRIDLSSLKSDSSRFTQVLASVGDDRDQPGQFHFVAATAGGLTAETGSTAAQPGFMRGWLDQKQERMEDLISTWPTPALPSWLNLTISWQTDWLSRWQDSWWRLLLGEGKITDPKDQLWIVDSGNYQLQATSHSGPDSARPTSRPLIPGSLGIASLKTRRRLAGQLAPDVPLLVVCNYLTSLVTIYQYHPVLDQLVPYRVFGTKGSLPWQLDRPQGLTIDPLNQDILIADSGNHRIARWRLTLSGIAGLVEVFGKSGDGEGEFNTPSDLCMDDQGHCYVADQFNHRIQVFDGQGQWLRSFGEAGYATEGDRFLLPTSIACEQGHLIVSDLVNRAIKIFTLEGEFLDSFSGFGADPDQGQLWMPYLMQVKNNQVYLPDCALNRINIYQLNLGSS
ncbi:NHL repeat-containing protein [Marinospirillum sp.]|uniref:NHL repeat-containing protein n=1 Tax=Marinospirillum sp. TaxID=2183934 RepID=UPI002870AFC3|nr:NHL repeat-containing protein [Marinospirillum sp.]MDR9467909.1 NHL repeat-containing protein [Marinospirillum sp.]